MLLEDCEDKHTGKNEAFITSLSLLTKYMIGYITGNEIISPGAGKLNCFFYAGIKKFHAYDFN